MQALRLAISAGAVVEAADARLRDHLDLVPAERG